MMVLLFAAFLMILEYDSILYQKIQRREDVFKMIKDGAFIYVCGDAKGMAQGVHKALVQIISEGNKVSEEDATNIIKMMKTTGKYQEDVW